MSTPAIHVHSTLWVKMDIHESGDKATRSSSPQPVFELTASPHFSGWLAARRASLVFTTYQTSKLFLIGVQPSGRLSIFERTLDPPLSLDRKVSGLMDRGCESCT